MIEPPPSVVELIKSNLRADSIWKLWFSRLYDTVKNLDAQTTINGKLITDADSPYTVTTADNWLFCNPIAADITVNLPAGTEWRTCFIKNYVATGSNAVIVVPNGAETIEDSASLTLNRPNSSQIVYLVDDSNWVII